MCSQSLLIRLGRAGDSSGLLIVSLENLLNGLLGLRLCLHIGKGILGKGLLELKADNMPSGHKVVEVNDLHEGLDLGSLLHLGLSHSSYDLARVSVDTGNEGVTELLKVIALVVGLDNDSLAAGVAAVEHDDNTSVLDAKK